MVLVRERQGAAGAAGFCTFYSKVKLAKELTYIFSNLDSSYKLVYVAETKERYSHEQWLTKGGSKGPMALVPLESKERL